MRTVGSSALLTVVCAGVSRDERCVHGQSDHCEEDDRGSKGGWRPLICAVIRSAWLMQVDVHSHSRAMDGVCSCVGGGQHLNFRRRVGMRAWCSGHICDPLLRLFGRRACPLHAVYRYVVRL